MAAVKQRYHHGDLRTALLDSALEVIAHMLKRFDLIAVQEVNARFDRFLKIVQKMMLSGLGLLQ